MYNSRQTKCIMYNSIQTSPAAISKSAAQNVQNFFFSKESVEVREDWEFPRLISNDNYRTLESGTLPLPPILLELTRILIRGTPGNVSTNLESLIAWTESWKIIYILPSVADKYNLLASWIVFHGKFSISPFLQELDQF